MSGDSAEQMLGNALFEPRLLTTPLVRNEHQVTVGPALAVWKAWIEAERQRVSGRRP